MIASESRVAPASVWQEFQKLTPAKAFTLFADNARVRCVPAGVAAQGQGQIASFLAKYMDSMELRVAEHKVSTVETSERIVEEAVVTFVHEREIDWMLPGVRPTNRRLVTIISFDVDSKISSLHFYWDQASLLKQIGILPTSMYCKANNSEVVLPVQGVRVADVLVADSDEVEEYDMPPMQTQMSNLIAQMSQQSISRPISGVFHDQEVHSQRRQQPSAPAQKTAMSSILSGEDTRQFIKPSTRVHMPPGGLSSNIFASDAPAPVQQRRNPSQNNIFGDATEDIKHIPRRDPNRSSVSQESNDDFRSSSKKQFAPQQSQEDMYAPPTGRKMVSNSTGSSFSLQHDEFVSRQQPALTRRDPNARSEENYQRPSSRVLNHPGGRSTLTLG